MEIQEHAAGLTRNDLIADTVNTYNKILQLTAFRESERASVAALEEQEQNVRLLVNVGRAATVDLLKVEVQLANERQRLLTLEESLSTLEATLRFLMGEEVGESRSPAFPCRFPFPACRIRRFSFRPCGSPRPKTRLSVGGQGRRRGGCGGENHLRKTPSLALRVDGVHRPGRVRPLVPGGELVRWDQPEYSPFRQVPSGRPGP